MVQHPTIFFLVKLPNKNADKNIIATSMFFKWKSINYLEVLWKRQQSQFPKSNFLEKKRKEIVKVRQVSVATIIEFIPHERIHIKWNSPISVVNQMFTQQEYLLLCIKKSDNSICIFLMHDFLILSQFFFLSFHFFV